MAELEEIAAGLTDLLAEVTEILTGFHQGDLEEPEAKAAAELCRLASADETLIPQRLEGGRRRAVIARRMPQSGPAAASARQRPQRLRLLTGGRGSWLLAATILVITAAVITALRLLPASSAGPTPASSRRADPGQFSRADPGQFSRADPGQFSRADPGQFSRADADADRRDRRLDAQA